MIISLTTSESVCSFIGFSLPREGNGAKGQRSMVKSGRKVTSLDACLTLPTTPSVSILDSLAQVWNSQCSFRL